MNYLNLTYSPVKDFILMGTNFKNGKERIFAFFTQNHTNKEKVAFLKEAYGIGGFNCDKKIPCSIYSADWNASGINLKFYYPNGIKGTCHIGYAMLSSMIEDMITEKVYMKAKSLLSLTYILDKEEEARKNQPVKKDLWAVKKALAPVFNKEQVKGQMSILDYVEFG